MERRELIRENAWLEGGIGQAVETRAEGKRLRATIVKETGPEEPAGEQGEENPRAGQAREDRAVGLGLQPGHALLHRLDLLNSTGQGVNLGLLSLEGSLLLLEAFQ